MAAGGRLFTQAMAEELATASRIALICGRYEGIDERAFAILGAEQVSIGDYVLTGGELAATVIIDALSDLPGVIDAASVAEESHRDRLVGTPAPARLSRAGERRRSSSADTTPRSPAGGGEESVRRTARFRPDLLAGAVITPEEREIAQEVLTEESQEGTDAKSVPPTREQI